MVMHNLNKFRLFPVHFCLPRLPWIPLLLLGCLGRLGHCYKPVIIMHGLFNEPKHYEICKQFIQQAHPGTNVSIIDAFNGEKSVRPMWKQIDIIKSMMIQIFNENPEGVHVICYSQGGLICRGVLSVVKHNVETFVSLSSPQAGQFGDTVYLKYLFPHYIRDNIYRYFFTESGQRWSVANYWNDPHEQDLYRKFSEFLAVLNNQTFNPSSLSYKDNFIRIKDLVLIGGPNDGVITPWQSSHFAFYDKTETVVEMNQTEWYLKDWFGLKTLDSRGSIHTYAIPGVEHVLWHSNKTVFDCCIEKWLT